MITQRAIKAGSADYQLVALSRLFSSGVVREMARKGKSPLCIRLAKQTSLESSLSSTKPVGTLFDSAFDALRHEGFRHEYIYKAALTHKILLGKHSLHTAAMLNEFRVGECQADVVILNGTSTVYEVKSERDSLKRLTRQIAAYAKVFAGVCVIAAEDHLKAVQRAVPPEVGILRLTARHQISTVQNIVYRPEDTCPASIFDCIRTDEARMILQLNNVRIPTVPNTMLNSELRALFVKLTPRAAHDGMVKILRSSRTLLPLLNLMNELPYSLRTAALCVPLRKADHRRLLAAVKTPLADAMAWV